MLTRRLNECAQGTGSAGGADVFMMCTIGLFALGAPVARATVAIVLLAVPLRASFQRRLLALLESLASFSGTEVLLLAWVLVLLEMTPITSTIASALKADWASASTVTLAQLSLSLSLSRLPSIERPRPCMGVLTHMSGC